MGNLPIKPANSGDFADIGDDGDSGELSRAHELAWAMLDDRITTEESAELESLLLTDATARESYIRCVQLHADLASHFMPPAKSKTEAQSKSPVLGFLNEGFPQFGSPSAEDAKS